LKNKLNRHQNQVICTSGSKDMKIFDPPRIIGSNFSEILK